MIWELWESYTQKDLGFLAVPVRDAVTIIDRDIWASDAAAGDCLPLHVGRGGGPNF
jgi:hypothetical protein